MTSPDTTAGRSSKAAIKDLIAGRTKILERLVDQLEKVDQAKTAVTRAQQTASEQAAAARTIYQDAMEAGWTATELAAAGLKPPAPPRKRTSVDDPATLEAVPAACDNGPKNSAATDGP